jgi:antiviral helicase SKI2
VHIPLSDVECLTGHITKGIAPEIFQGGDAYVTAKSLLHDICRDWTSGIWDEADLSKLRNLQLHELIKSRKEAAEAASTSPALSCPDFLKHVSTICGGSLTFT